MSKIALIKINYEGSDEYYSKVKKFESTLEEFTGKEIGSITVEFYNTSDFFKGGIEYKIDLDEITPEQMKELQDIKKFEIKYLN